MTKKTKANAKMRKIEKMYGKDFGVMGNQSVCDFLREKGYDSLADMLQKDKGEDNILDNWKEMLDNDFIDLYVELETTKKSKIPKMILAQRYFEEFIERLLKAKDEEAKDMIETILKHGHGGGNWRRLVMQAKSRYMDTKNKK